MSFASTAITKDARRANRPTCILITDEGIYWPLADYFLQRNLSLSAERGYARSIARLMNWTRAKHPNFQAGGEPDGAIFSSFLHDLLYGTIRDEEDASDLWWGTHSPDVVKRTAAHIAEFSEWLEHMGLGVAINPKDRPASSFERMIASQAFQRRKAASMMAHAKSANSARDGFSFTRRISAPGKQDKLLASPPAFPEEKINDLLWIGFENERFKNDPRPWVRWNLRDILITLLCLYGGVRVSEPMHVWVDDVLVDESDPSSCRVLIHDPERGKTLTHDPVVGERLVSRADYLSQKCRTVPLTRASGGRRAGWKGGLLTIPERRAFEVIWIDQDAGRLFNALWKIYARHLRPLTPNSPWAFFTKQGLSMGTAAYQDSLKRAVNKIGLTSRKHAGTTPHGLRHRYGQWLNDKGISEKAGQICLHHANPMSQHVYRQITLQQATEEVNAAGIKISVPVLPRSAK